MQHSIHRAIPQQFTARALGYALALVLILAVLVLGASAMFTPARSAAPPIRPTPATIAPANYDLPRDPVYYTEQRDDNYMLGSYGG